jgi:hypothetical protein
MIEPVQASAARPAASGGSTQARSSTDFAAVMAGATDSTAERFERLQRQLRTPRGERWEAVPGHSDYADIVSGPRNGYFVNIGDGPRRGEVFHRIRKDGHEYHVYGEGRSREVVEVKRRDVDEARDPSDVRPREGEAFEAVTGHRDYQRIEGGARDDLFINLSGNERTGRAFDIVERDGNRYHVYGEGDNKLEIRVGFRRRTETGGAGDPES